MMVTALSTQNKELTSKDLHAPKKNKNSSFRKTHAGHFLVFHQLPYQKNMVLFLNHNYLKILGLINHQTRHYFHYQMPK